MKKTITVEQFIDQLRVFKLYNDNVHLEIKMSKQECLDIYDYIESLEKNIYEKKGILSYEYDKETLTSIVCELQDRIDKAVKYLNLKVDLDKNHLEEAINDMKEDLLEILKKGE